MWFFVGGAIGAFTGGCAAYLLYAGVGFLRERELAERFAGMRDPAYRRRDALALRRSDNS
jgi:threonine/homoserine/homoserine lactone efflux protein